MVGIRVALKISDTASHQSSRSHCLFTLTVTSKSILHDGSIMESTGKLHMVDLAGSECAKTAGGPGQVLSFNMPPQSCLTLQFPGRIKRAGAQEHQPESPHSWPRHHCSALQGRCPIPHSGPSPSFSRRFSSLFPDVVPRFQAHSAAPRVFGWTV